MNAALKGKIGRLLKAVQEQVNRRLEEGEQAPRPEDGEGVAGPAQRTQPYQDFGGRVRPPIFKTPTLRFEPVPLPLKMARVSNRSTGH